MPARFTLEPHCYRGEEGRGETCELFNALLKPPRLGTRKNPKLAPNRTVLFRPSCSPAGTARPCANGPAKLCANFAYILFGSVKGSRSRHANFRWARRKDFRARRFSGTCSSGHLIYWKLSSHDSQRSMTDWSAFSKKADLCFSRS